MAPEDQGAVRQVRLDGKPRGPRKEVPEVWTLTVSIQAIVRDVRYEDDGTATLLLDPYKGEGPGQSSLVVENPNPHLRGLIGLMIWGGDAHIVHREVVIADRISYRRIRMRVEPVRSEIQRARAHDPCDVKIT